MGQRTSVWLLQTSDRRDGDQFRLALAYGNFNDVAAILQTLGIPLRRVDGNAPATAYNGEIADFPGYQQPSHIQVAGIKCHCWVELGEISFSLFGADGDLYRVTEKDFENCLALEKLFIAKGLAEKVSRGFEKREICISRQRYPELFNH